MGKNIILASQSPRRKQLLTEAGYQFVSQAIDIDESFPSDLHPESVAIYLAEKKIGTYTNKLNSNTLVITADTVVISDNQILGKPLDQIEAFEMLRNLSGKSHKVISGVCISDGNQLIKFDDVTEVFFKHLTDHEIHYYIKKYKPFDKAGAYGIQEWIGMIGIEKIIGSYFNVVGLPIQKLHEELKKFNIFPG